MNDDFLEMIEPTPKLHTKRCQTVAFILKILLQFAIYVSTIISWLVYDYFIAFFTLILSFIIVGIIRSKIRNSVIPIKQREFQYNDKGIADWYTARELCIELSDEKKKDLIL